MNETDVIVVGAGPTGLMLACELALAGVRCRLLERRTEQPNITRAFAVHARTLELLDARDLAGDLLARGLRVHEVQPAPGATLDLRSLETRFPMILIVPQSGTEHVLEARARELGVEIVRGAEVTGIRQDARRVELDLADGRTESAAYVVGCDGAHSAVRRLIGVDFAGRQYETHILLADVRLTAPPGQALFATGNDAGVVIMVPFGDGWFRAIAWDRLREQIPLTVPLPMEEMRDAFHRIAGTDFGMSEQRWSSRFRSERRQARHYRVGRVFLAGDAAHVHSPLGGQGMNTGIQDALNLGWKLAAAVRGRAPAGLLDGYEGERHRVGAQVLALTDGFNRLVLGRSAVRRAAQAMAIRLILRFGPTRRILAGRLTGLGIAYPAATRGAHPWTGRRMPDLACEGGRLYELLRDGCFRLVDMTASGAVAEAVASAAPEVQVTRYAGPARTGRPAVILVRPDGYVAWASGGHPDLPARAAAEAARWSDPHPATNPTPGPRA
ncbi:FAD-dependent monooxygenase [Nonomuraea angiospora]|uniref:FAD-dependent monooxygenase n=1 Tax=Nonomuraea angiospora TaxID=46172 RepID=UPI003334A061